MNKYQKLAGSYYQPDEPTRRPTTLRGNQVNIQGNLVNIQGNLVNVQSNLVNIQAIW
jgi:hypothetical protein